MRKKYNTLFILFLIFLFALIIRIINLNSLPYSMHADEVVNTFVGRYILLHGVDPNGNVWPLLYFDKFGDYPPVLPMYLSGIATFLFGVTAFSSRIPSVLIGSLLIFPIFFLTKRFFNKKVAYIASFILAIFPWHIVLSRASAEGIIALTCFAFGLLLFIKSFDKEQYLLTPIAVLLCGLSYLLYSSFRIITPLAIFPLLFFYQNKKKKLVILIISLIFFGLTLGISGTTWGKGRFIQTSVFTNKDVITGIRTENQIFSNNEGKNNILIARLFHNKITGYYWVLVSNYLSYFSPNFLFFQEGKPERYVVPQEGLLLLVFLVFLAVVGLFSNKKYRISSFYYVVYLLIISPLPAALTTDDSPNIHRSITLIIPLTIFIAIGLAVILEYLKGQSFLVRKISYTFLVLVIGIQFLYYWHQYSISQTSYKSILRNDGNKELVMYVWANKSKYSHIVLPSNLALSAYYLFYTNNFTERKFSKFLSIDTIDNIEFQGEDCPSQRLEKQQVNPHWLLVDNADCKTRSYYHIVQSIKRKDGTGAFKILVAK